MVIDGLWPAQKSLQQAVDVGGWQQVVAAGDQGDALDGVIVGGAEMVAGGGILAGEHGIAEADGGAGDLAGGAIGEGERGGEAGQRAGGIQAQGVRGVGGEQGGSIGAVAAGAGVAGRAVGIEQGAGGGGVGGGGGRGDVGAGAEAGIDQVAGGKGGKGGAVGGHLGGLVKGRTVPIEAEPVQVVFDRLGVLRAAAGGVDVFDAQQEGAVGRAGRLPGEQGGANVAEMQGAGGAGGEAGDDQGGRRSSRAMETRVARMRNEAFRVPLRLPATLELPATRRR